MVSSHYGFMDMKIMSDSNYFNPLRNLIFKRLPIQFSFNNSNNFSMDLFKTRFW